MTNTQPTERRLCDQRFVNGPCSLEDGADKRHTCTLGNGHTTDYHLCDCGTMQRTD